MNKEQFGQFWGQLKAPLKAKWVRITEEDLVEIKGTSIRSTPSFRSGTANSRRMK